MARNKKRSPLVWVVPLVVVLLLALWLPAMFNSGSLPEVGDQIADFVVIDSAGERFQLSEAYAEGEVVLVFYRGFG